MDDALNAALGRTADAFRAALARELVALGCGTAIELRMDGERVTIGARDAALREAALGRAGLPPDGRFHQAAMRASEAIRRARGGDDR